MTLPRAIVLTGDQVARAPLKLANNDLSPFETLSQTRVWWRNQRAMLASIADSSTGEFAERTRAMLAKADEALALLDLLATMPEYDRH